MEKLYGLATSLRPLKALTRNLSPASTAETPRRTAGAHALALAGVIAGVALLAPTTAQAHFVRSAWSYKDSCVKANRKDPVGLVFYGQDGTASAADQTIEFVTGWNSRIDLSGQNLQSHGNCYHYDKSVAQHPTGSRFHVRLWQMPGKDLKGRYETFGTPHHEDYVFGHGCGLFGNHAIDQNGSQGSGFDQGRERVVNALTSKGYSIGLEENWGNTQSIKQCDGGYAGSNGTVYWIKF